MSDDTLTGREVLDRQLTRLMRAIHLLNDQDGGELVLPALMLLYATIDGLAWLQRRTPEGDADHVDFEGWVDRYLLPDWTGAVTSEALWAARCALLHSQAAESRHTRAGKVPEIWYRWNDFGIVPIGASLPMLSLNVHPGRLIQALEEAIKRFLAAVDSDPELGWRVEQQARKLWTPILWLPETEKGGA